MNTSHHSNKEADNMPADGEGKHNEEEEEGSMQGLPTDPEHLSKRTKVLVAGTKNTAK